MTIKSASEQYKRLWQKKSGLVNHKIELQFSHLTEHLWVHYSWEKVQTCKHILGIWPWKPGQDSIFSPKCPEVFNASHKSVSHSPFLSPINSTCSVCAFQSSDSLYHRYHKKKWEGALRWVITKYHDPQEGAKRWEKQDVCGLSAMAMFRCIVHTCTTAFPGLTRTTKNSGLQGIALLSFLHYRVLDTVKIYYL